MADTVRVAKGEEAVIARPAAVKVSMQEALRGIGRDDLPGGEHRARVALAADLLLGVHARAIDRLGR